MNPPTNQSGKGESRETRDGNLYHIGLKPVKEDEPQLVESGPSGAGLAIPRILFFQRWRRETISRLEQGSGAGVVGSGTPFEPLTEGR